MKRTEEGSQFLEVLMSGAPHSFGIEVMQANEMLGGASQLSACCNEKKRRPMLSDTQRISFCSFQTRFGQVVRFSQRLLVVFLFAKRSLVDSRCGVQWAALQQSLPSGVSGLVLRISAGWVNQAIPVTHATTSRAQTIVFPCRTSYCTCSFTAWLYSCSEGVNVENPVQSPTTGRLQKLFIVPLFLSSIQLRWYNPWGFGWSPNRRLFLRDPGLHEEAQMVVTILEGETMRNLSQHSQRHWSCYTKARSSFSFAARSIHSGHWCKWQLSSLLDPIFLAKLTCAGVDQLPAHFPYNWGMGNLNSSTQQ